MFVKNNNEPLIGVNKLIIEKKNEDKNKLLNKSVR